MYKIDVVENLGYYPLIIYPAKADSFAQSWMPKTRILACHSLVMHELSRNSLAEIVAAHSLEITPDSLS